MNLIYSDIHKVTIHSKPNDEKTCNYRISVELEAAVHGKAYNIKITDDDDPTFLYNLLLQEDDFSVLKSQQMLRTDFDNFSKHLSRLLAECKSKKEQFFLILDEVEIDEKSFKARPGCFLKIFEGNEFKNLCHLSLCVVPGSDDDIRKHLRDKLTLAQDKLTREQAENCRLRCQNNEFNADILDKEKKITALELRLADETSFLRLEMSQRLACEKEKHEKDKKEAEMAHQLIKDELQQRIEYLTKKNTNLVEAKSDVESNLKVMTLKKETAEKDLNRLSLSNIELEATVSKLNRNIISLEKNLSETSRRLSKAEGERQELIARLNQARRAKETSQERERALTAELNKTDLDLQNAMAQLDHAKKELAHFKVKFSEKVKKLGDLLKVVEILEERLEKAMEEVNAKTKLLTDLQTAKSDLEKELQAVKTKAEALEGKAKEHEAIIRRHTDINACLHRKLNEKITAANSLNASAPAITDATHNFSLKSASKTLPPWLPSDNSDSTRKPLLDPSYLVPAVIGKEKKIERTKSAYFSTKSSPGHSTS